MTEFAPSIRISQRSRWLTLLLGLLALCALLINSSQTILLLAAATLVSEDLTCIATGELIRRGQLDGFIGVVGCFVGIYAGDLGLWALGHFIGPRILSWRALRRRIDLRRAEQLGE